MPYLYLIKCQQYYKIGVANDIQSRLAQLSTGNPFELEPVTVCGFDNASAVEAVLHQRFASKRQRGEWFALDTQDVVTFDKIIYLLGGTTPPVITEVNDAEIEEAEEIQKEILDDGEWDFVAMFSDGWRMERTTNGRHTGEGSRYWCWRKGNASKGKQYIYGGVLSELPHSIEEMRELYNQKGNGYDK